MIVDGDYLVAGEEAQITFRTPIDRGRAQLVVHNSRGRPAEASLCWNGGREEDADDRAGRNPVADRSRCGGRHILDHLRGPGFPPRRSAISTRGASRFRLAASRSSAGDASAERPRVPL